MTYHHQTKTPVTHLYFYTFLDALAFLFGVMFGSFALGYAMHLYLFGGL